MKRITKAVVAVLAVSALLVGTCPGKEKHQSVIKDKLGETIKKELDAQEINTDNPFARIIGGFRFTVTGWFYRKQPEGQELRPVQFRKSG
jgi:hypothetical protein